jgi:hypothetical protein
MEQREEVGVEKHPASEIILAIFAELLPALLIFYLP